MQNKTLIIGAVIIVGVLGFIVGQEKLRGRLIHWQ